MTVYWNFGTKNTAIGAVGATFTYEQVSASATWVIQHFLGKYPAVAVVDTANTEVIGDITYDSPQQLTVRFSAPFSGSAFLN